MKKSLVISTILASSIFLVSCAVEPGKKVPKEFEAGQKQYHRVCAGCHGADAMGGNNAPSFLQEKFLPKLFSNKKFESTIINGSDSGAMASQKRKVSDEQTKQIIKYIRHTQQEAGLTN